jgi:hypothetical protein
MVFCRVCTEVKVRAILDKNDNKNGHGEARDVKKGVRAKNRHIFGTWVSRDVFGGPNPEHVATPGHSTHTTTHHHGGAAILSQEVKRMRGWVVERISRSWDTYPTREEQRRA